MLDRSAPRGSQRLPESADTPEEAGRLAVAQGFGPVGSRAMVAAQGATANLLVAVLEELKLMNQKLDDLIAKTQP